MQRGRSAPSPHSASADARKRAEVGGGWGRGVVRASHHRAKSPHPHPYPLPTRGRGTDHGWEHRCAFRRTSLIMHIKGIEPIAVSLPMKKPVFMAGVEIRQ